MALLIAITLWLLLIILTFVCLALITPVFVRVHLTTLPQFTYHVELRALAGLAPRITLAKGPVVNPRVNKMPKAARSKRRTIHSRKRGHAPMVRAVPTLIKGILRGIHLTKLHIDADYGLYDPAETGWLFGLLTPLQYAAPIPANASLDLRADFTKPCLTGNLTAVFRVTLAALLIPVTLFAWRAYGQRR